MDLKATIIILDFMKASRVVKNVGCIMAQEVDFGFKVVVIDNSCNESNANILKDGLKDYKNVELVINPQNSGYIKAHNEIKDRIEGNYIVIVNPDVLFKEKEALGKMVSFMDANPNVGILGPKQINDSGEIAMTVRAWPKLYVQVARRTFLRQWPWFKDKVAYDEMRHLDYSKTQDVDWVQSSCIIVRKDLWNRIGRLNENYFLFMSDVELCVESWKNKLRVVYYPEAQVYADGKRLSAGGFLTFFKSWTLRQHVRDALKYRMKYFLVANPRKEYYRSIRKK